MCSQVNGECAVKSTENVQSSQRRMCSQVNGECAVKSTENERDARDESHASLSLTACDTFVRTRKASGAQQSALFANGDGAVHTDRVMSTA
jgi:deoxyxylulose-5-phosphate synthase